MKQLLSKYYRQLESLFFIGMSVAMAFVVFVGFARTFFLSFLWSKPAASASSNPVFYIHGVVFAGWMVFAVAQPMLVKVGLARWHRKIGWVGVALAILVVLTGIQVALVAAARPASAVPPPLALDLLGVVVSGILIFGLLVALAVLFRRDIQSHKRLMLLASVNMLQAAISRIPLAFLHNSRPMTTFLVAYFFIILLMIWDIFMLRRIHMTTFCAGLGIMVSLPLRFWVSNTEIWRTVARWLIHLFH